MTETTTPKDVKDAEAAKDAEVLAGVLTDPKDGEKTTAAPPRRARRASAPAAKPATKTAAKTPAKATAKPAPAKAAAKPATKTPAKAPAKNQTPPKSESNGSAPSAREANQKLAVELIDLVAASFAGKSKADQEKIANWLKVLPTGGTGWQRYWPAKFARPTTSDWQKPE